MKEKRKDGGREEGKEEKCNLKALSESSILEESLCYERIWKRLINIQ